jgi:hypothetical protein
MSDYSEHDARFAGGLIDQLFDGSSEIADLDDGLSIADVERDTADFKGDVDFLRDVGAELPALMVRGEEPTPISLRMLLFSEFGSIGPAMPRRLFPSFRFSPWGDVLYDRLRSMRSGGDDARIRFISLGEAEGVFRGRATRFLAGRVAAVRQLRENYNFFQSNLFTASLRLSQRLNGMPQAVPGCQFTVTTNSQGLRVLWSGAYYLSANNFNHPTSPTTSVLQAGDYMFGVDGGAYGHDIHWDENAVVSLPGLPHVHLNF